MPEGGIADITSVLTVLGGRAVHGDAEYKDLAPKLPPAMPNWSPVRTLGGYRRANRAAKGGHIFAATCRCSSACSIHGHAHASAWCGTVPVSDDRAFWGVLGCSCWAF